MNQKSYRTGAIGALMDEYERAASDLINILTSISQDIFIKIYDYETKDEDCRSIKTVMHHVVDAGFRYANQMPSQIGTGTAGLLASGLTDQIKKRTKKIFGNYMLKIDPNIVSNIAGASFENTSRLIVGKEISKDFLVVYATNFDFSSQRQQVLYLQYHISPLVSLIGMRNEEGQISLDIRFRKRH